MAARLLQPDLLAALIKRMSPRTGDAVVRAREHCRTLGEPLSAMPELVFALLNEQSRPVGAYDLIDDLTRLVGRPVKPPTVYRAIEQLLAAKLIARLATRNAFVACAHPGHRHDCVLMVCDRCGRTDELEDSKLDKLIEADVRRSGFEPRHRTLEVEGTCRSCQPLVGARVGAKP
jgi:Fur family transcriptional regulator, zinc uptake regulator